MALDAESENAIGEATRELFKGRAVFVVAHRLSTVRDATRILVLDKGRIVESGRHEELLAANGLYARLHALQFRASGALPLDSNHLATDFGDSGPDSRPSASDTGDVDPSEFRQD